MERPYRITRAQWDAMSKAKVLEPDVVYLIGEDTVVCARLSPGDVATLDPTLVSTMAGGTDGPGTEGMVSPAQPAPADDQDAAGAEVPRRGAGIAGGIVLAAAGVGLGYLAVRGGVRLRAWCC